jgi:hypothetical protein
MLAIIAPAALWYAHVSDRPLSFGIWRSDNKFTSLKLLESPQVWRDLSSRVLFELLGCAGLVLVIAGITLRARSEAMRVVSVYFMSLIAVFLCTLAGQNRHNYYQLPFLIPASLAGAAALAALVRGSFWSKGLLVVLAGLQAITVRYALYSPSNPHRAFNEDPALVATIEAIRKHVPPGQVLVSSVREPALWASSGRRAYYAADVGAQALRECMRGTTPYVLVQENRLEELLSTSPRNLMLLWAGDKFSLWRTR